MILREIGFSDTSHPIISGILKYLDSGKDFADGKWFNTVPGNNDYPHAVWWKCEGAGLPADNPTVSLAGFALRFADKASALYRKACEIATKSVAEFMKIPLTNVIPSGALLIYSAIASKLRNSIYLTLMPFAM